MTAPRVPVGWTQEAADLVWRDWLTRMIGLVNGWGYDATAAIPGLRLSPLSGRDAEAEELYEAFWTSDAARLHAWAAVGAPVLTAEASRILDAARALSVALEGSEAVDPWMGLAHVVSAVRAEAAAVGAPVLAPAEDGRPSLAEWVAACEGSALGQPAWSVLDSRFTDQPLQATWPQVWLRIDVEDEPTVWAGPPVQRFFTTPAELRALLDTLARPA